ncbi:hypothetical protein BH09VER1_BH09VER1_26630 [soil metagenome]
MKLVYLSGMRAFPPRLPEQPIFYPVLNQGYAEQIARDWNTQPGTSGYGFVLRFEVDADYLWKFETQVVGGREHAELWIPAEELGDFNRHIVGPIGVAKVFRGEGANSELDITTLLPTEWLKRAQTSTLFEGRHCRIRTVNGWEYVERVNASGVVAILAITDEDKIILIEQFRPPLGKIVIEIPAGLAGDIEGSEGEELASAARRELLEETGYQAGQMEYLTEGPASAGLSTEVITFFRAEGLIKVAKGGGDGSEKISVYEIPLVHLDSWITDRRAAGCEVDYKVYAALYFHLRGTLQ